MVDSPTTSALYAQKSQRTNTSRELSCVCPKGPNLRTVVTTDNDGSLAAVRRGNHHARAVTDAATPTLPSSTRGHRPVAVPAKGVSCGL